MEMGNVIMVVVGFNIAITMFLYAGLASRN